MDQTKQNEELVEWLDSLRDGWPDWEKFEKVEIDTKSTCGDYPIHWAVINNRADLVQTMLQKGVDVNILGETDCTPLDYANIHEHEKIAEILRSHGGTTNQT